VRQRRPFAICALEVVQSGIGCVLAVAAIVRVGAGVGEKSGEMTSTERTIKASPASIEDGRREVSQATRTVAGLHLHRRAVAADDSGAVSTEVHIFQSKHSPRPIQGFAMRV
jgi:hypothetical protein